MSYISTPPAPITVRSIIARVVEAIKAPTFELPFAPRIVASYQLQIGDVVLLDGERFKVLTKNDRTAWEPRTVTRRVWGFTLQPEVGGKIIFVTNHTEWTQVA